MKAKQWMFIGFLLMSMAVKGENRVTPSCLARACAALSSRGQQTWHYHGHPFLWTTEARQTDCQSTVNNFV